ncbi:type II toxin-antitoxin system PemK/MazF family toxin [Syntrophomonas wolfei]|jgi:mRNA interferase MazF|uniref:type II toxin-antitoxin system PemK/MazF family toxin n=1 Tax=Syntrophomonas wolfei TaxID=863 RepID=UPI0023F4985C|nr:type II toxin-antitoxin system PemK/MazF family toxin [Syntrophomonas wolfei]
MTSYKRGDVILIPFPFSDLSGSKKRPALVLAAINDWRELVCMMLTSSLKGINEITVSHLENAGLPKPTVARIHRIFTIDQSIALKKLGSLHPADLKNVMNALRLMLTS